MSEIKEQVRNILVFEKEESVNWAKCFRNGMEYSHNKLASRIEPLLIEMAEALEKYSDGRAFDFDRTIRGEIHFNHTLSASTAKTVLQKLKDLAEDGK